MSRKEAVRGYLRIAAEFHDLEARVDGIDDMVAIQCSDGNWNTSEYMRGLANGLLLAQAILRNRDYEPFGVPPAAEHAAQKEN